ncbi:hypothetical protein BDZ94DRAFT_1304813 [Collybia nuda]|uniref:Uncharacterized protein n=1 Tax=Collybia nuda TaxID=64659 RepID=A0A9P5YHT9_9AGAR|nr:hypothetical protein BDZ94DRAFT_1304813 [Collybia nuda]
MKFAFAPLAAVLAASSALAQQFTINTPTNVVVCQPILLTWVGGTPPYFLRFPGNQPGAAALEDLGQQTGNQFTWLVNIAAGTSIGLSLRDNSGQTVQSAPFDINSGTDTSCVGKNPSSSGAAPPANTGSSSGSSTGGPAAPPTTPPTGPSTTPPTTPSTTPPATSGSSTVSKPNTSTSGTPPPSNSNAASSNGAHFGAAGMIGAAAIALLI